MKRIVSQPHLTQSDLFVDFELCILDMHAVESLRSINRCTSQSVVVIGKVSKVENISCNW